MWGLYRKEISSFFSSLVAYIVIGIFLTMMGLVMWIFPEYSLLESRYVSLSQLFYIAPFLFMFLIPAVTMSSFAEEKQLGTLELLQTKPISDVEIVLSKYFANLTLIFIALLPTLLYYFSVYQLGLPKGNIDSGGVIGSYIGLLLLSGIFVAIGMWASSMSKNQIIAFVVATFLCFIFYLSFYLISEIPSFVGYVDALIQKIGIDYHYQSISRGVVDTRDVIYFLSVTSLFIYITVIQLRSRNW